MYSILDIRGRLLRKFYGSDDTSVPTNNGGCAKWQAALNDTLEQYVWPVIESGYAPMNVIAVWDSGNTYRRGIWADYKKARREKEQDPAEKAEMDTLMEKAKELFSALGIKQVWCPGEEADDIIALLCQNLEGAKTIYTSDKDLLVLASDDVWVNLDGALHGGDHGFSQNPLGIPYDLVSLHKALIGDPSDGYSGVPGLGKKGFEGLVERYQHNGLRWLQSVIDRDAPQELENYLADATIKKIYENWPITRRCWRLAKLAPEACYGANNGKVKRPQWKVRIPNWDRFSALYRTLHQEGFGEAGAEILNQRLDFLKPLFPQTRLVTAEHAGELPRIMSEVLESPLVSYDFESYDTLQNPAFQTAKKGFVDVLSQSLTGISINYGPACEKTIYVPFNHKDTSNLTKEWAVWILSVLSQREGPTVVQNANFELTVAQADLGFMPKAPHDTQIMASYVDENEESNLKDMSLRVLGYRQLTYAETTQGRGMNELTGEEVLQYGCDDSLVTSHLYSLFRIVMQCEGSWAFYLDNEVEPAVDDAWNFLEGVEIDYEQLKKLQKESQEVLRKAQDEIRASLESNLKQTELSVQQGAAKLLAEWWVTERYKYEGDEEKTAEHYTNLWNRAWNACIYQKYSETVESKEFTPTATNFALVLQHLDEAAPRPKKLTKKGIEEYEIELTDYVGKSKLPPETKETLYEFLELLYAARNNLASGKRSGEAYERLREFCSGPLSRAAKPKTKKVGTELNLNSDKQMQAMLYGFLELTIRRHSKVTAGSMRDKRKLPGAAATGLKAVETALAFDVQEDSDWRRPLLQNYREAAKQIQLESLYFSKYPLWQHPRDGRIHPGLKNCGTVTRRPSGSSPNVLQVAKGPMRTIFLGGKYEGDNEPRVVVSLDHSNQELLLLACESRDPVLLDVFLSSPRKDAHSVTSIGFAHTLLPRLGLPVSGPMTYEEFVAALHSEDPNVSGPTKKLRNKYSKACIAKGSLVLTNAGLVPIEDVKLHHKVWDGVEWVNHEGVIYKGIQPVITYSGLTATPDHEVYLDDGSCCSALSALERGSSLAIGESQGNPRPYLAAGERSTYRGGKISGLCNLPKVWRHDEIASDSWRDPRNSSEKKEANKKVAVYDIVNAGPRHRFTVSGKVVSNCNFLMAYSGGFHTLAENLSISPELAKELMNKTFDLYKRIQPWQSEVADFARKHGYSLTAYGNRRHVTNDIHSLDDGKRKRMERQASNATIQSTAADILKKVRQEMFIREMRQRYRLRGVFPVYDEVTASVPISLAEAYAFEMKEIMEITPPGYPVGMQTELSIGPTWGTQEELPFDSLEIQKHLESLLP